MARDKEQGGNTKNKGVAVFVLPDSHKHYTYFSSLNCLHSSVQSLSHVRLCNPMNHSTLGLPVHHQLPEFTQTHAHRVSDAI